MAKTKTEVDEAIQEALKVLQEDVKKLLDQHARELQAFIRSELLGQLGL
jgi:hypothetical protein